MTKPGLPMGSAERPNRANPRQRAQRAETRERLIDGAIRVFSAKGYVNTTVEDILSEAGVSRASFYAHFAGKAAVVEAMIENFAPIWQPAYVELSTMPHDLERLTAWCRRNVAMYRSNQPLCIIMTQAASIEPDLYWKLSDYQEALTDQLAAGNPALAHLAHDKAARLRAVLALSQIDQACYFLAVRRWQDDPEAGVEAMAAQLHHFLTTEAARGMAL